MPACRNLARSIGEMGGKGQFFVVGVPVRGRTVEGFARIEGSQRDREAPRDTPLVQFAADYAVERAANHVLEHGGAETAARCRRRRGAAGFVPDKGNIVAEPRPAELQPSAVA